MNFYGALGDYEKTVRERKYKIADAEDKILYLKQKLKDIQSQNQKLEQKCENLELQFQMEDARYEAEAKKKSQLETVHSSLTQDYKESSTKLERKKALLEKIKTFRLSRIANFKNMEQDYMERYREIPSVGALMRLSDQQKELQNTLKELQREIKNKQESVTKLDEKSKGNWNEFVDLCIKTAVTYQLITTKVKECEDLKKKIEQGEKAELNPQGNNTEVVTSSNEEVSNPDAENNADLTKQGKPSSPKRQKTQLESTPTRSLSIDQRLQLLRSKTDRIQGMSSADGDKKATTMGISRYFKAVEAHEATRRQRAVTLGSKIQQQSQPSMNSAIEEIRKKYSSVELKTEEESKLAKLLKGFKSAYSSQTSNYSGDDALTNTGAAHKIDLQQEANKENVSINKDPVKTSDGSATTKETGITNTKENCELVKAPEPEVESHSKNPQTTSSSNILETPKEQARLDVAKNGRPIVAAKSATSSKEATGVFKMPPPKTPLVSISKGNSNNNSKDTSSELGNNFFNKISSSLPQSSADKNNSTKDNVNTSISTLEFGIGSSDNSSSSSMNPLDIFGITSKDCGDNATNFNNDSDNSSSTSSSPMLFDFENYFGSGKGRPLF